MGKCFLFLLLLSLSWPLMAEARRLGCAKEYEHIYRETRAARFLTEADRVSIAAIREAPDFSSEEKAKAVFHLVLSARLRASGIEEREWVEKALSTVKVKPTSGRLNARYNGFTHNVKVTIPESLLGSAVEYMLKIHELEHALQHGRVRQSGGMFFQMGTKTTLLTEADAISLEWRYLHQLPEDLLSELQERVRRGQLKGPMRKYLSAALADAQLPFQQYLDHQRALGRYSKNQVRMMTAMTYGQVGTAVAATVYLIYAENRPSP